LPWWRQQGCPALLHWQVILNFNSNKNTYKPPSNGVCHTYNFPQNRAGIFLAKCLYVSFRPPAVPSLLLGAAFSPSSFPHVYSGMFQGSVIISKESTVRAQAMEVFFSAVITWPNQTHFPPGYWNVDLLPQDHLPSKWSLPKHRGTKAVF